MKRINNLFICFTGIDGSGKTTIAKKLTNKLKENNLPAVYVYARFQLFLSKPIVFIGNKLLLRKYSITENYNDYTRKKKTLNKKHEFMSRIYLHVLLIDYLLQLIIKIKIPLMLRKNVVCDRYVYDTVITDLAVDMSFSKSEITSLIDRCFLLVPKPYVTFIIDVQEDIAYKRKNDIPSIDYLIDRRSMYRHLGEYYDMVLLNGNNKPDEVFTECLRRLENEFDL